MHKGSVPTDGDYVVTKEKEEEEEEISTHVAATAPLWVALVPSLLLPSLTSSQSQRRLGNSLDKGRERGEKRERDGWMNL